MVTLQIHDGDQHQIEVTEEHTLLDVLMHAQTNFWSDGRRLLQVAVDGDIVQTLDEATLRQIPARQQTVTVWLEQNEMSRDIGEILEEADVYLARLESGFAELAELFRAQGGQQHHQMLSDAMVGVTTILQLVQTLFQTKGVPRALITDFEAFLGELNEKSRELNEAQEGEDMTLIADILEYEFVDVIQMLKQHLDHVKPYVQPSVPGS